MHRRKKLNKFGEILEQIGPLVQEISKKEVSRSSHAILFLAKMCFVTVLCIELKFALLLFITLPV